MAKSLKQSLKKNWYIIFLLLLTIGLGVVIFLTTQKLRQKGPVAPTVPQAKPKAAAPDCSLTFNLTQAVTLSCGGVCSQALLQGFWRGNSGYSRIVPIGSDGNPKWNQASAWSDPIAITTFPGSGNFQALDGFILPGGKTLVQQFWRGNQGYSRTVPIGSDGKPNIAAASAWSAPMPISNLPGGGDMQALSSFILPGGKTLVQEFWRGNQGFLRTVPIGTDGNVNWSAASGWGQPIQPYTLPGSGNIQAFDRFVLPGNKLLYESLWRGNRGYSRTVTIDADGNVAWEVAPAWSAPIDPSGLPGSGDIQDNSGIVLFSTGGTCGSGLTCDSVCKIPACVGNTCTCATATVAGVPDCDSLTTTADLNNLHIGTEYTFKLRAISSGAPITSVEVSVYGASCSDNLKTYAPKSVNGPGTYDIKWTPTQLGAFTAYGRVWNDAIAECRSDCVDGPPRYLCAHASSCKLTGTVKQIIITPTPTNTPTPTPTPRPPTPTPTPRPPTPTPTPTQIVIAPTPTPTPLPAIVGSCGGNCSGGVSCSGNLACIQTNSGTSVCTMLQYQTACQENPSTTSCCSAPPAPTSGALAPTSTPAPGEVAFAPTPKVPVSGNGPSILGATIIGAGALLLLLGLAL